MTLTFILSLTGRGDRKRREQGIRGEHDPWLTGRRESAGCMMIGGNFCCGVRCGGSAEKDPGFFARARHARENDKSFKIQAGSLFKNSSG